MSQISKFLECVSENRHGYCFSEPERIDKDSLAVVVPILRKTSRKRQYILIGEGGDDVRVLDSGSIDLMTVENKTDSIVFVRSGTIFRGGTQERTATRSAIVFPGSKQAIDVRCVNRTKGINQGTVTKASGVTPLEIEKMSYAAGYTPKDQGTFWNGVQSYMSTMGCGTQPKPQPFPTGRLVKSRPLGRSQGKSRVRPLLHINPNQSLLRSQTSDQGPASYSAGPASGQGVTWTGGGNQIKLQGLSSTGGATGDGARFVGVSPVMDPNSFDPGMDFGSDLASAMDKVAIDLDDVLSKVKLQPTQAGLAILNEKGCQTIELFDIPESWAALHNDAVKRVGHDLSRKDKDSAFDYKPQFAVKTVSAILAQPYKENLIFEHRPHNGEPPFSIFGLTSEKFIGEVVELDKRIIHVNLLRIND